MKRLIATVFMAIATSVFGSQQTQVAEARERHIREVQIDRARHIAELQRAEAEKKILEIERQEIEMLERDKRIRDIVEAERAKMLERAHTSSQSLEEYRARRKAKIAARVAEKNKRLVKQLTKESSDLRRKNEQLRKELDKTINELAEYRSQAKYLSEQLRSLPKSLGRGVSSGPARRRK